MNLIWLVPDGVRIIPFNDPVGRFKCFDNIKLDDFFEFKNMYTTAPSTFMSFMSFLTGTYSTKMASKYGELKSHKLEINTIKNIFNQNGYNIYFFTWLADLKNQLNTFETIEFVDDKKEFLNFHLNYDDKNKDITYIMNLIKKGLKEPFFLFIHLCAREFDDPLDSLNCDYNNDFYSLYLCIKKNLNFENSVIIIHSDHGFPTFKGEDDSSYFFMHDTVISQDNIKVPFFIKVPNKKGVNIYKNASLIDIYPTLMELFNFNPTHSIDGISLFKIIENKSNDRIIRVDNRFLNQSDAKIALIKDNEKFVYNVDKNEYKLFRIGNGIEENEIEMQNEWIRFFENYQLSFIKKRDDFFKKMRINKKERINKLLKNFKLIFFKLYNKNEFLDEFVIEKNIEFSNNLDILNEFYVCLLLENILDFEQDKYQNFFETLFKNYKKDKIFIIDSYLNLDIVKTEYFLFYIKNQEKILKDKKYRNNRKREILDSYKKEYFRLWCERNKYSK